MDSRAAAGAAAAVQARLAASAPDTRKPMAPAVATNLWVQIVERVYSHHWYFVEDSKSDKPMASPPN